MDRWYFVKQNEVTFIVNVDKIISGDNKDNDVINIVKYENSSALFPGNVCIRCYLLESGDLYIHPDDQIESTKNESSSNSDSSWVPTESLAETESEAEMNLTKSKLNKRQYPNKNNDNTESQTQSNQQRTNDDQNQTVVEENFPVKNYRHKIQQENDNNRHAMCKEDNGNVIVSQIIDKKVSYKSVEDRCSASSVNRRISRRSSLQGIVKPSRRSAPPVTKRAVFTTELSSHTSDLDPTKICFAPVEESEKKSWVPIGSGQVLVRRKEYDRVKWKSYTTATRDLLVAAFPRDILATRSLTGKLSPAFRDRPQKLRLDERVVSDIISEVHKVFCTSEKLIRLAITTKCADEAKMRRMKMRKESHDKENIYEDSDD